ncbi:MAG: hypothetical protein L0Y45_00770 [Woeseiaceae bacterium]|nr:hypothetical protein [Woeseiaceae bacterium]
MKKLSAVAVLVIVACALSSQYAQAGLSGDAIIDSTLGTAYKLRAGGSGGGIDRGTNRVKCNTQGAHPQEQQCPNDATCTPAAATGGYQAWGVGARHMFSEELEIDCILVPHIIWQNGITVWFETVCVVMPVSNPDGTWGNSMARLK